MWRWVEDEVHDVVFEGFVVGDCCGGEVDGWLGLGGWVLVWGCWREFWVGIIWFIHFCGGLRCRKAMRWVCGDLFVV